MEKFCQNPLCENQAVKKVAVSVKAPSDQMRALCAACEEAHSWGVQHGLMSSDESKSHESQVQERNMLNKVYDAIEEVLESLDVGGEQSRQYAEEIRILKDVIGYPQPVMGALDEVQRRQQIVWKLRRLAVKAEGLTVDLPTLPVKNWLDGTVADATKDVFFESHDLAKLLRFIADVGVSQGD
jgi:hypothetical protein